MAETLYEKLKRAETANLDLHNASINLYETVKRFSDAPDISVVTDVLPKQLPDISVPNYQRKIIESYALNNIVLDALRRKKSVETKTEELTAIKKGFIRTFLPRYRNEQHNAEVEQLEELISPVGDFKLYGLRESPLIAGLCTSSAVGGFCLACVPASSKAGLEWALYSVAVTFFGVTLSLLTEQTAAQQVSITLKYQASYIDKKIEELF